MQDPQEAAHAIEAAAAPANKKKPGRPKKKVEAEPIQVHGIVNAPVNEGDVMELVSYNPMIFRRLFALHKGYNSSKVGLYFDGTGARFTSNGHSKKNDVLQIIDGRGLGLYYCGFPILIYVQRESLESILATLCKTHASITFTLRENYRSIMYISISDSDYETIESYEVDVLYGSEEEAHNVSIDDDIDYPIKFKTSSKHLKTKISNIGKLSDELVLQKVGDEPLRMTFNKAKKGKLTMVTSYMNKERICLDSKLGPDQIFTATLMIEDIKPFSNSLIGEDVHIAANNRDKVSFTAFLDKKEIGWGVCVKVFTRVEEYRRAATD